jgi:tetratricopeptide (TPR) repeat protein
MLSKLEELKETILEFIHQDRHSALVIRLAENELAYVLKTIAALDQQEPAHVFGLFAQPVSGDEGAYVDSVLGALRAQLEPVGEMRVADGQPAWPAFPAACSDPRVAGSRRLRAAIAHAAGLVPGGPEHCLVFSLLPQSIANPHAYASSLSALLPSSIAASEPAWPKVRLIVRDDGVKPVLIDRLRREKNPDVLVYEPDLSPAALMDAMARDVADPAVPEPARMQLLTELAALDAAHGRLDEAIAKYGVAYDFYRHLKVPVMQAFILQGLGDVLRRLGNLPMAKERYAQGLTLTLDTQAVALMMTLAYAVGDVSLELRQYQDAEAHLEIARKVAATLRNRAVEADALEKIGVVRAALGRSGEAKQAWKDAAEACRAVGYNERLRAVLEREMRLSRGPEGAR